IDTDLDGLLSETELQAGVPSSLRPLVRFMFPGFDADGDGLLSFAEYRLCPLVDFNENWQTPREDRNSDGFLSWEEFAAELKIENVAMAAFLFKKLDVSGDGQLDVHEFPFTTSQRDLPREFAIFDTDGDGVVSLEELLIRHPRTRHPRLQRDFQ